MDQQAQHELLTEHEAADLLRLKVKTLQARRVSGGGAVLSGETPITNGFEARWDAGLIANAGVDYHLTSAWGVRAEYRYQTALAHSNAEVVGITFRFF